MATVAEQRGWAGAGGWASQPLGGGASGTPARSGKASGRPDPRACMRARALELSGAQSHYAPNPLGMKPVASANLVDS